MLKPCRYLNNLRPGGIGMRGHAPLTPRSLSTPSNSLYPQLNSALLAGHSKFTAVTVVFRQTSSRALTGLNYDILLPQRTPYDSFPLNWKIPGGTVDPSVDRSVIDVAIRELLEETQLRAWTLSCPVGLGFPYGVLNITLVGAAEDAKMDAESNFCLLRVSGLVWDVMTFMANVEDEQASIALQEDEDEDVEWAWVTEPEVENGRELGKKIEFMMGATRMIVVKGFILRKKIAEKCDQEAPR